MFIKVALRFLALHLPLTEVFFPLPTPNTFCHSPIPPRVVWSPKKLINSTLYGCEVTPKLLDYFEHYFDIRYSLPKMDLIALPDFGAKGMENWGIVTFA